MAEFDRERRTSPRASTYFFAVELKGNDLYYRVVTNLSRDGFFYEEPVPTEQLGDEVVMDFPLPGRSEPLRVRGEVRFISPRRGIGVRITDPGRPEHLERLVAAPPPPRDDE